MGYVIQIGFFQLGFYVVLNVFNGSDIVFECVGDGVCYGVWYIGVVVSYFVCCLCYCCFDLCDVEWYQCFILVLDFCWLVDIY